MGINIDWVWALFHADFHQFQRYPFAYLVPENVGHFHHFQHLLLNFHSFQLRKMSDFQVETFVNMDENSELPVLQDLNLNSTR